MQPIMKGYFKAKVMFRNITFATIYICFLLENIFFSLSLYKNNYLSLLKINTQLICFLLGNSVNVKHI